MRIPVSIGSTYVYAYNEEEARAIEELDRLIRFGETSSCRLALKALNILMQRRLIHLAQEADRLLAEVIRSGGCPDL